MFPDLSAATQSFVRSAYGLLMIATLLQALPEARRFFMSERWGGYAKSSAGVDAIQNPRVLPWLLALWIAVAVALVPGWMTPWPALVNLVLCRYLFVHMRWKSVLRGMGAPGFIAYWVGFAVFLLEYTSRFAPGPSTSLGAGLRPLALLVIQIDFAFIMLSAGVYKFTAGYPRNEGMELGLCNPMWGYWWRWYVRRRPAHPVFWISNQLAWGTEVVAALMMLFPPTRELGGLLIVVSFAYILTQIRLGFLCEMVMVAGLLFMTPGGVVDGWISAVAPAAAVAAEPGPLARLANGVLAVALWAYLVLLPIAHAGMYYNFYARRRFPPLVQRALEWYTNAFGIIIWRVFSVDVVNFFIRVTTEPRAGGTRAELAPLGTWPRFNHVGEMICLTSLFTTLKYYPSQGDLFRERLLRYARTLPHAPDSVLVFEYVGVVKRDTAFDWVPVAEYRVDVATAAVEERLLDPAFSPRAVHAASPVHEGATPGSYAPAK